MLNVIITRGVPGATFTMTSTDTAQSLTAASIAGSKGAKCIGALITCDTNDIQYAFGGTTVVQGGVGHLFDISTGVAILWLSSGRSVSSFQFISAVGATHGKLQVTPFFQFGKA